MKEKEKKSTKIDEKRKAVLKKIINRRKELDISQMDMAILIGIGFSGYFKIETGKTKLDTARLFVILEKLEISAKDFFTDFDTF